MVKVETSQIMHWWVISVTSHDNIPLLFPLKCHMVDELNNLQYISSTCDKIPMISMNLVVIETTPPVGGEVCSCIRVEPYWARQGRAKIRETMGEPNMPIMMVDQYHHDWLSHYTTYHDIIMIDEKQWNNHNVDGREILHQLKNHPFGGAGFRNHPQYHGSPRCIRKHSKSSILYRYSHNFFSKKKRRTANHKSKIALTKLKRTSTKKCRLSAPRISNTASVKPSTGPSQSAYHLLSNRRIWEPCCAVNLRSTSLADVTRMISQTQKKTKRGCGSWDIKNLAHILSYPPIVLKRHLIAEGLFSEMIRLPALIEDKLWISSYNSWVVAGRGLLLPAYSLSDSEDNI